MNKAIDLYLEEIPGFCRAQLGGFEEVLSAEEASMLSTLAFAQADDPTSHATLGFMCPRRRVKTISRELAGTGARVSTFDTGPFKAFLGSCALVSHGLDQNGLALALRLSWEHSPLVWGIRDSLTPTELELGWLPKTVVPSLAFADDWRSLLVSFYHGAWVGVYGRDTRDLRSRIGDVVHKSGFVLREANEPM